MSAGSQWMFVPDAAAWTPGAGFVVRIPAQICTKRELFGRLRRQLTFPGHFGWNWDALNDCLRDLTWLGEVRQITLIHEGLPFGDGSTRLRKTYFELLRGLVEDPAADGPTWTIVFPESVRAAVQRATSVEAQG